MRGDPTPAEQAELEVDWAAAVGRRFRTDDGEAVARIVLEQVADEYFALRDGFLWCDPDGTTIRVLPSDLRDERTDLTSVPRALTWFVGRYGRHTPAALLHDALLHRAEQAVADGGSPLAGYEQADRTFLVALRSLRVPPLRALTMWAAVALGTRLRTPGWPRLAILAWGVAFVAGTATLLGGVLAGEVVPTVAAGLAPLVGSALWGRQYRAGVVASYAAPFVAVPTLAGFTSFLLYRAVEAVVLRLPGVRDRYEGTPYTGM